MLSRGIPANSPGGELATEPIRNAPPCSSKQEKDASLRPADPVGAKRAHVAHSRIRHKTRDRREVARLRNGLPVSPSCPGDPRKTRPCFPAAKESNFCPWLFLAPARLPALPHAQNPETLLGTKARQK